MFGSASPPTWSARAVLTVVVLGALVAPVVFDRDSFPLSTYPMYASVRSSETSVPTAVAVDADGVEHRLSLGLIGASDDPLIVASGLRRSIASGRAADTCQEIAARAAGRGYVAVEVVTERHDVVARASDEPSLVARETHSRCEVEP